MLDPAMRGFIRPDLTNGKLKMSTMKHYRLGEIVVPLIALAGCALYWLHVQDAQPVAQRVPETVIIFTVICTAIVLIRVIFFPAAGSSQENGSEEKASALRRGDFIRSSLFILLCVGYYMVFSRLGFNLANLIFLLLAYPLAGLNITWSIFGAFSSSAVFCGLAWVMKFNVPLGPLGF